MTARIARAKIGYVADVRLLRVTIRAVVHFVDWLEYQTEGKPRFHELDPALAEQCRHLSQRL